MRETPQLGLLAAAAAILLVVAQPALAQPVNDAWANRKAVTALPYSDSQAQLESATVEAEDPVLLCRVGAASQGASTVWYEYATGGSVEYVNLSTQTSSYDTVISVYTGDPGSFDLAAGGCNDDGVYGEFQSRIAGLRLEPNTRYSIEVARYSASVQAATLNLSMSRAPLYPVTTTDDTPIGTCDFTGCTLREAITAANVTPGAILLPPGVYAFQQGAADDDTNDSGDLDIRNGLAIYGSGTAETVIDASQIDRVLHVDPLAFNRLTVTVADLTLRNGTVSGDGGAVRVSGTSNFVTLQRVRLADNVATGSGGALSSTSRGAVLDCTVAANIALGFGGGLSLTGGSDSTILIEGSTISGNRSQAVADAGGGGVYSLARVRISNSTVSGNSANAHGGGLFVSNGGSGALRSVTVADNVSDFDEDGTGSGGGIYIDQVTGWTVENSILADNEDRTATPAPDCYDNWSAPVATAHNHVENAAGACSFTGTGDVTGSDPGLGPLADNGGLTQTHALADDSPAVNGGDPAGCRDALSALLVHDQRGAGFQRDQNGICDKGAFELFTDVVFADGMEE